LAKRSRAKQNGSRLLFLNYYVGWNQSLLIILNIFDLRVVLDCDWLAHQLVVRGTACHWLAVLCCSGWLELGWNK